MDVFDRSNKFEYKNGLNHNVATLLVLNRPTLWQHRSRNAIKSRSEDSPSSFLTDELVSAQAFSPFLRCQIEKGKGGGGGAFFFFSFHPLNFGIERHSSIHPNQMIHWCLLLLPRGRERKIQQCRFYCLFFCFIIS